VNWTELKELSSYSLKTVVMHLKRDRKDLEWKESNLVELFLEVKKRQRNVIES
jgi:hypothetical protein